LPFDLIKNHASDKKTYSSFFNVNRLGNAIREVFMIIFIFTPSCVYDLEMGLQPVALQLNLPG
jgi:hypothetical protein